MRLLLDTHILIWAADEFERLPQQFREQLNAADTAPVFSAISIWEISIKGAARRPDFGFDAHDLRARALHAGYEELAFTGEHGVAVASLPAIHRDPFDRALVAQAIVEKIELVTRDKVLQRYPATIRVV